MKIEIGGGVHPKGEGFTNVDMCDSADVKCDLNDVPWPIDTDSAAEVYSAHCLEHLINPIAAAAEMARIGRVGSTVTIRVPDPCSEMAFVSGHLSAIGEVFFRNILDHFPDEMWPRKDKILRITSIEHRADATWFPRARENALFARWTDDEIMQWIPRTCHETEFKFVVTHMVQPVGG